MKVEPIKHWQVFRQFEKEERINPDVNPFEFIVQHIEDVIPNATLEDVVQVQKYILDKFNYGD